MISESREHCRTLDRTSWFEPLTSGMRELGDNVAANGMIKPAVVHSTEMNGKCPLHVNDHL